MSNVRPLLPKLTVNRAFMAELMAAPAPCFALGLVEERKRQCGFMALRPDAVIPPDISHQGFRFGHALLGTSDYEVIQFIFEFYGFGTYQALINPNNPLVRIVLTKMVESADYFFFAINANQTATAFRSEIGQRDLAGLKTNLPRIQRSTTTDLQYQKALSSFTRNPQPAGTLMNWVCREKMKYLDLTENRLELNPA